MRSFLETWASVFLFTVITVLVVCIVGVALIIVALPIINWGWTWWTILSSVLIFITIMALLAYLDEKIF